MSQEFFLSQRVLKQLIEVKVTVLDKGINLLITGGEKSHIGAVSISVPKLEVKTIELPGHKESVISEAWARELSGLLKEPVSVECGIHYDGIDREQIEEIVLACSGLLEEVKNELPNYYCR